MSPCCPMARFLRPIGGALAVLTGMLLFAGCDLDGYPEDLKYPPRSDPLAVNKADKDAIDYDRPGQFPELFVYLSTDERDKLLLPRIEATCFARR